MPCGRVWRAGRDGAGPLTGALPDTVVIPRPRHPLERRPLRVLGQLRRHGRLELLLVLPDGSKSLVPAAWTDLEGVAGDAAGVTATLAPLRDLLAVCALVSAASARHPATSQGEDAPRPSPYLPDLSWCEP